MIFFLLPKTYEYLYRSLNIPHSLTKKLNISTTLNSYLETFKHKMTELTDEFTYYNQYTNPCYFIKELIPKKRITVSKLKQTNIAFYELYEIYNTFRLNIRSSFKKCLFLHDPDNSYRECIQTIETTAKIIDEPVTAPICHLVVIGKCDPSILAVGLMAQSDGGNLVIRMSETSSELSARMLYLICSFYEMVYMMKPQCSNFTNDERYIICKGFVRPQTDDFIAAMSSVIKMGDIGGSWNISTYFLSKLEEYNAIFGQQQLECIHHTFYLIDMKSRGNKLEYLLQNNLQKCVAWCEKNGVPFNPEVLTSATQQHFPMTNTNVIVVNDM